MNTILPIIISLNCFGIIIALLNLGEKIDRLRRTISDYGFDIREAIRLLSYINKN